MPEHDDAERDGAEHDGAEHGLGEAIERAAKRIEVAPSVALACHVGPDGDALGSMLAMHHLCRANGKPSIASFPEPFVVAPHYLFLPGLDLITKPADFPPAPEVMMTFDCGSLDRLGELAAPARAAAELIVVDHHLSNERYGTLNVIDVDAAATAVVVRKLAERLGWSLNRDAALCLYTGLVTDTGRFQYQSTTPAVFMLAAELASFDLPIAAMSRMLFEEHHLDYLHLAGERLAQATLDAEIGLVAASISSADLHRHHVAIEETEGFIDLVRRASEADVSCVLKETPDGIRVSLRSLHTIDVSLIAEGFGGGGHRYAAGFTANGSVDEVLDAIRVALRTARAAT